MIDDILDSLDMDFDPEALDASEFNVNEGLSLSESITSSTVNDEILSIPSSQLGSNDISSNGVLDLFPDGANQNIEQEIGRGIQMDFPHQIESLFAPDYLDTSNPIDVDNLVNIPHTDGLDLSREDIEQLSDRAEDVHRGDISFGKKGDPGECCTRHCCTGASYCNASYGDFHR